VQRSFAFALVAALSLAAPQAGCAEPVDSLPQLGIEGPVTVSGLSSGAFFAHQFHIADSDLVEGAAIVAGGPYACASDVPLTLRANPMPQVATAIAVCTHTARDAFGPFASAIPAAPDADASVDAVAAAFREGAVADPGNVADDRVWLFHGGEDEIVPEGSMAAVGEVYRALGVRGDRLGTVRRRDAAHGFPVDEAPDSEFGAPACGETARPYLIDCDLDGAGALLSHLLGDLARPVAPVGEHLVTFDQTAYFDEEDERVSLAAEGFVYVPAACREDGAACRLHVAFHGCRQGASFVGDDFVRDAGYNGWAEANGIVVLYPQVEAWTRAADPTGATANPRGCWDWWGYSGDDFATRDAPQMRAVRAMAEALDVTAR